MLDCLNPCAQNGNGVWQLQDAADLLSKQACILRERVGLGKTLIALGALDELFKLKRITRCLIVAPATVMDQWKEEINKHQVGRCGIITGSKYQRQLGYYNYEQLDIMIVAYQTVLNDFDYVARLKFDVVILDEAAAIKSREAKSSQAVKAMAWKSPFRWLLTADPVQNNLEELFSLMEVVDPTVLGDYDAFRVRHLIEKTKRIGSMKWGRQYGIRVIVGYRHAEEIRAKVEKYIVSNSPVEQLDNLPGVQVENRIVDLYPEQQRRYAQILDGYMEVNGNFDKINLLEQLIRLLEVCDWVKLVDPSATCPSAKMDAAEQAILDNCVERKVLVYSAYKEVLYELNQRMIRRGVGCTFITGDVPLPIRAHNRKQFNEDPRIVVCFVTVAAERGLNLQSGSVIVLVDRHFNPSRNGQVIGRINRIGQKEAFIKVISIVARGTVDEMVFKRLSGKIQLVNTMFPTRKLNSLGLEEVKMIIQESKYVVRQNNPG